MRIGQWTALAALVVGAAACDRATNAGPVRYNFGIVDGANQVATAGDSVLARPITSQLARDPNGKFAMRAIDLALPKRAYAQGLTMPGTPVAGALICAREAKAGEPTVFPLCAFTLSDGRAPSTVKAGTKAGRFQVVYSAQVQSQQPVMDSTTVTVQPGPVAQILYLGAGFETYGQTPFAVDNYPGEPSPFVRDRYGNAIPYKLVVAGGIVHALSDTIGALSARTLVLDADGTGAVSVVTATGVIANGVVTGSGFGSANSTVIRLGQFKAP